MAAAFSARRFVLMSRCCPMCSNVGKRTTCLPSCVMNARHFTSTLQRSVALVSSHVCDVALLFHLPLPRRGSNNGAEEAGGTGPNPR